MRDHAPTQHVAQPDIGADNYRNRCSTIARMFSDELMDIFRIDNSVADLDEQVDKRLVAARIMHSTAATSTVH